MLLSIHRRRPGLTLPEFLVVIVMLLALVAVVVTFLQGSRETANRIHCAHNLKLLGEAIHVYGDKHKFRDVAGKEQKPLPAARIADSYATWAVQILPFLTAKTPADKEWDLQKSYLEQTDGARERVLPEFFCPSRTRPGKLSSNGDAQEKGNHLRGSLGDYACAAGDGNPTFPWTGPQANGAIILGNVLERKDDLILRWQSRTTFAALERGLGYTILVGEKHVPSEGFGQVEFGDGSLYNGSQPANFSRVGGPGFGLAPSTTAPLNNNFGSYHPGVCQFLLGDTSVRALATNISEEILGKLIVR